MLKHVRKFHSEEAKRKAVDTAELTRLELSESQTGGAVSTRGMKKDIESTKTDPKAVKDEPKGS